MIRNNMHWVGLVVGALFAFVGFGYAGALSGHVATGSSLAAMLARWDVAAFLFVFAYFIGAVPFGLITAQLFGLGNLREIGSGNIGTTNVLRTGSKSAAALTLILDMSKGIIAVLMGKLIAPEFGAVAMLGAILGHCYPVWLKFRGGKGVATYLGGLLGLAWPLGLIALAIWLITALITRISSVAALSTIALMPIFVFFFSGSVAMLFVALSGATIIWKHQENIGRLMRGEESKISFSKKS